MKLAVGRWGALTDAGAHAHFHDKDDSHRESMGLGNRCYLQNVEGRYGLTRSGNTQSKFWERGFLSQHLKICIYLQLWRRQAVQVLALYSSLFGGIYFSWEIPNNNFSQFGSTTHMAFNATRSNILHIITNLFPQTLDTSTFWFL